MKKHGVFFNCILVPFLAAVVCLLLMVVFHLDGTRLFMMGLFMRINPMMMASPIAYFRIMDTIAFLPCALFCCRNVFKSKAKKKIIISVAVAVILAVAFGVGCSFVLDMVDSVFRLTAWGLVLNFIVALAALIVFNLFFTEEYRESKEIYEAMEKSRKEAEEKARFAAFMSNPAARSKMAHDAVAYKGNSGTKSIVKGAVIGGAVAGPAGAVVGAIAGKNKADQKASAASVDPAMQAVAYKKDDGTKTIVKDAVIGGIVAGPAGAVVGAIVGKDKADKEK